MSEPRVTAVIPLHNHEKWVGQAIESIANQTLLPNYIMIVDDGSTDTSLSVAESTVMDYCKFKDKAFCDKAKDDPTVTRILADIKEIPTVILSFQQARGPSFARNVGVRGYLDFTDVFAFLDSDDVYAPTKIEKSIAIMKENPDIGVVYSDFDTIRQDDSLHLTCEQIMTDGKLWHQYKEPFSRARLLQECIVNCDSLISKRAFELAGLFDEELRTVEDYDLWLRISEKMMICHLPESLVKIRVGSHSSSNTVKLAEWNKNYQRVRDKLAERANNK